MAAGAELLAAGCRHDAWTSNKTMLHRVLSPARMPCAQMRQTMMLATQREL